MAFLSNVSRNIGRRHSKKQSLLLALGIVKVLFDFDTKEHPPEFSAINLKTTLSIVAE